MTILEDRIIGGERYIEGVCLSTETKPTTGVAMGSKLFVLDENTTYYYKNEDDGWIIPTTPEG